MAGEFWYEASALLPSIGVGLLFWFVVRAMIRADRREREAEREAEKVLKAERVRRDSAKETGDARSTVKNGDPDGGAQQETPIPHGKEPDHLV